MKKFILIDHSIVKVGGHYLEYAQNVLSQLKGQYDIWLATNQRLQSREGLEDYHVYPVYPYDIWGKAPMEKKSSGFSAFLKAGKAQLKELEFQLRYLLTFSAVGYAVKGGNSGNVFMSKSVWKALLLTLGAFLCVLISIVPYMVWKILRLLWWLVKFCADKLGLTKAIQLFSKIFTKERAKRLLTQADVIRGFEKATLKLLRKIHVQAGDIIFVPTLSVLDLTAIHRTIENTPEGKQCTWHLLFRRNLFEGREPEYMAQIAHQTDLQEQLAYFSQCDNVFFYTDTEALTAQYSRVSQVKFITLPIPINPDFQLEGKGDTEDVFTVTYAGDARSEKGYQYIPDIVEKLEPVMAENSIRFELQSNFTFKSPKDDASVVAARNRLEQADPEKVILHKQPMDSATYCEMVKRASLGLLLYDRNNYYARSSGALVECLAGGIPVIVPSASWLADQIMPAVVAYQLALEKTMNAHIVAPIRETSWLPYSYISSFLNFSIQLECGNRFDGDMEKRLSNLLIQYRNFTKDELAQIAHTYEGLPLLERVGYFCNLIFGEPTLHAAATGEVALFGHSMTKAKWLLIRDTTKSVFARFTLDERTEVGVYVRTRCVFYDQYCHKISEAQADCGKLESIDGQCTVLLRIPKGTRAVLMELSCPWSEAPALCREFSVELWDYGDFPISAVGSIYVNEEEVSGLIKDQYHYRKHYRESAERFRTQWNTLHDSKNLIKTIESVAKGERVEK